MKKPGIFCSDIHAPYQEEDTIEFLVSVMEEWGCHRNLIIGGDLFDNHRAGNTHPHEQGALNPNDELELSLKFTKELCKEFPKGIYISGNHENRIKKVMKQFHCPDGYLKDPIERHGLGKKWVAHDSYLINYKDGTIFCEHGDNMGGSAGAPRDRAISLQSSTMYGHWHSGAGVQRTNTGFNEYFMANAGYLGDGKSVAFKYDKGHKKGITGCLVYFSPTECYFVKKETYKACKL